MTKADVLRLLRRSERWHRNALSVCKEPYDRGYKMGQAHGLAEAIRALTARGTVTKRKAQ